MIEPQEEKTLIFILGVVKEKGDAPEIVSRYLDDQVCLQEFNNLAESWNQYLSNLHVETPDAEVNRILNVWNPYQCKVTFDWSRYVSLYETGIGRGMGFRDCSQDSMGINFIYPERVRQRLLDLTKNQFESGKVYHVYFPLTGEGDFRIMQKKTCSFSATTTCGSFHCLGLHQRNRRFNDTRRNCAVCRGIHCISLQPPKEGH